MERIQHLLEKSKKGCKDSQELLLKRLEPLIIRQIKKFYNIPPYDDSLQEAYLLVLESFREYDKRYKVPFLAFISLRLKYYFLDKNKEKVHLSLNYENVESESEYIDLLEDPQDYEELALMKLVGEKVYACLNSLPVRQREVLELFYFKGLTNKEISEVLHISYQTVANTKNRALKTLKGMVKKFC